MAFKMKEDDTEKNEHITGIVLASRLLRFFPNSLAGSGLPILASILASKLEPRHTTLFDSGAFSPDVCSCPVSVSDGDVAFVYSGPGSEVLMGGLQSGKVQSCVLGAAQIDALGRLNSTWLNTGGRTRRLPGAGGAPAMVSFCGAVVVLASHQTARFPVSCDYVSSDPTVRTNGSRADHSYFVATGKCIMAWSFQARKFEIKSIVKGCLLDEITSVIKYAEPAADIQEVEHPLPCELSALHELVGSNASRWNVAGRTSSWLRWS